MDSPLDDADVLSDAASVLRRATHDSLAAVTVEATAAAQTAGLTVLPASVDIDGTVVLDEEQVSLDQVIAAATASGSALLFIKPARVDSALSTSIAAATLAPPAEPGRAALLKALKRITGWTSEVELSFPHHGVMIVWSLAAEWAEEFNTLEHTFHRRWDRSTELLSRVNDPSRLDDASVAELAGRIAAVPQFRQAAARPADREAAARHLPEFDRLYEQRDGSWQARPVLRKAEELLDAQVDVYVEQLKPRLGELAALLAADENFRSARTAAVRQRFAQDWIHAHTDGLRMPTWWTNELVAMTKGLPATPAQLRL